MISKNIKSFGALTLCLAMMIVGLWSTANLLDNSNFRPQQIARSKGGKAIRAQENKIYDWIPHSDYTRFVRPITELDLSHCDLDDETMYWVCLNGTYLEKLTLDDNTDLTNESIADINKLSKLSDLSVHGTRIAKDLWKPSSHIHRSTHYWFDYLFNIAFFGASFLFALHILIGGEI